MKRAAIYIRTSKTTQCPENQLPALEKFCEERGFKVVRIYEEQESAWLAGHQHQLAALMKAAAHRHFDVVVIWALDRICREGISAIFLKIKALKVYGVNVLSYQEQWLEGLGAMQELFISLLAWVAQYESQRRSERTRAGLARARAAGKGKRGVDKKKRKTRVIKRPVIFEANVQAWH